MIFLLSISVFLFSCLLSRPLWPSWFSHQDPIDLSVLGDSTIVPSTPYPDRRIEVNLTTQQVYVLDGDQQIATYTVSSGKWNRTPAGTFTIWAKVRSQKMSGGNKELGTYYYLPNVPYIIFFYNDKITKRLGYSLHGTYWHDNFGTPMSHGCINMKTPDVAEIFSWADIGTQITIYGKYDPKLAVR